MVLIAKGYFTDLVDDYRIRRSNEQEDVDLVVAVNPPVKMLASSICIEPRNRSWITKVHASSWRTSHNKKMSHHQ